MDSNHDAPDRGATDPRTDHVRGQDVIRQASVRHAGFLPSKKAPRGGAALLLYGSVAELWLALWLELNPLIRTIFRGDQTERGARVRGVEPFQPSPYAISYVAADGTVREYWPDFVGDTVDDRLFGAEAGKLARKTRPDAVAALSAAVEHFTVGKGGAFFLSLEEEQKKRWFRNALSLHLSRFRAPDDPQLLDDIRAAWTGKRQTVLEVEAQLKGRRDRQTLRAAVLRVAGDAMAAGRLVADLERQVFSLHYATEISTGRAPARPLPAVRHQAPDIGEADSRYEHDPQLPTTVIDFDKLPAEVARRARAKLAVIVSIIDGARPREAFEAAGGKAALGIGQRRLEQLASEYPDHGETVVVPHRRYRRADTTVDARLQPIVKRLYVSGKKLTQIVESEELRRVAARYHLRTPSEYQVAHLIQLLKRQAEVNDAAHPRRRVPLTPAMGRVNFSEWRPGFECEVDEQYMDLLVEVPGTRGARRKVVPQRVWMAALKDVNTRCILSFILSPKRIDIQDYRRLLLRAIQPKDELVEQAGAKHAWPCTATPGVIRSDRAWIYAKATLARQAAEELGFVFNLGPVRQPQTHGSIESFWNGFKRQFEHRLVISVGNDITRRTAKSDRRVAAAAAGVSIYDLENAVIRYIVDSYHQDWSRGSRMPPIQAWRQGVEAFGLRSFIPVDADEPGRLLTMRVPGRLVTRKGVSFLGRWYGDKWAGDPDEDPRLKRRVGKDRLTNIIKDRQRDTVDLRVIEDDLRTVDAYDGGGIFLGVLVSNELGAYGRPFSRTEHVLARRAERVGAADAQRKALGARHRNERKLREAGQKTPHTGQEEPIDTGPEAVADTSSLPLRVPYLVADEELEYPEPDPDPMSDSSAA